MEVNNTRDFTETKKEELFECLDEIAKESTWKDFSTFSEVRASEFGDWDETLDISQYTAVIDEYQTAVVDLTTSLKEQIETKFTNINDIDRIYQQKLQEYYETVKSQSNKLLMITEAFSAPGEGSMTRCVQKIKGEEILIRELEAQGITNTKEQQEIIDMIKEYHPDMLINLYATDCYSTADTDAVFKEIMEEYEEHKKLEYSERMLELYLIENGYGNELEREFIISYVRETNPQALMNLYTTDRYSTSDSDDVAQNIIISYEKNVQGHSKNPYTLPEQTAMLLNISVDENGNPIITSEEQRQAYLDTMKLLADSEVMGLPEDVDGWFKTYTNYTSYSAEGTPAYKLQQVAYTNEEGLRVIKVEGVTDEAYLIAMGTYYTGDEKTAGEVFVITLDNGTVIYCVTGDVKQDIHTDSMHQYRLEGTDIKYANIVEFIIDKNHENLVGKLSTGTVGEAVKKLDGKIVEIRKLDIPSLVPVD